jgi:hypothetical protein
MAPSGDTSPASASCADATPASVIDVATTAICRYPARMPSRLSTDLAKDLAEDGMEVGVEDASCDMRVTIRTPGRGRALLGGQALVLAAAMSHSAVVRAQPAVDVALHEPPPPRRVAAIEWNPATLLIDRISFNVEIAPAEHHAFVLTPFYFYPRTSSFTNASGVFVQSQKFEGFGGEVGYRYYTNRGGLRGFYAGPSVFFMFPKASAGNGSETSFEDYGVAADIGYQALVGSDWVISLGGGAQYTFTSESIPRQQMPATIYANRGVQPRIDFSIGYAL